MDALLATTRLVTACPVTVMFVCVVTFADTTIPEPPENLTLRRVHTTSAEVTWQVNDVGNVIRKFKLVIRPAIVMSTEPLLSSEVRGSQRHYMFNYLTPNLMYKLSIIANGDSGNSNMSETITFTTISDKPVTDSRSFTAPRSGEVFVVALVMTAWLAALVLFLHKWGRLRIMPPASAYSYKQTPKNLHTVKVVARSNDSVIYRSYSQQHMRTMQAREKLMIQRMHTLPNIKIDTQTIAEYRQNIGDTTIAEETDEMAAEIARPSSRIEEEDKEEEKTPPDGMLQQQQQQQQVEGTSIETTQA